MSYYENRIKALEEKVAEMSRMQRMKAIPVEAKLVERIALLQAENKRLREAGRDLMCRLNIVDRRTTGIEVEEWLRATKGLPSIYDQKTADYGFAKHLSTPKK